jgi:hypothetical protein
MFRSSLPRRCLPAPAARLLRAVPRPAGLAVAAALTATGLAVGVPAAAQAAVPSTTFTYTGYEQTYTVPSGVTEVTMTAVGAPGASGFYINAGSGGEGAQVTATVPLPAGTTTLYVEVGGAGTSGGAGGFNGGGSSSGYPTTYSGGGGGGASDVRTVSCGSQSQCNTGGVAASLASRLVVAGGGGGGDNFGCDPGTNSGGGTAGDVTVTGPGDGSNGTDSCTAAPPGGNAGRGGNSGGTGGSGTAAVPGNGGNGSPGQGGNGDGWGGGGGGGYYGGGGGGTGLVGGGGGGAGSSFWVTGATNTSMSQGTSSQPAEVIVTPVPPLTVTTTSLPGGQVGTAYGQATLAATGGVTPYTWAVTSGSLPPGLTLDTSTGMISGTPTAYGTYSFTVTVTDAESPAMTASQPLSITVKPAPLMVTTTSLAAATGGKAYSATLGASGGIPAYTWSVPPGSLPPGLSLSATGVISGIPVVAGTYTFTVTVTDAESPAMTATATLSISVSGPVITKLQQDQGPFFGSTAVLITGTGLSCPPRDRSCKVTVTFGQRRALVVLDRPTKIWVLAPPGSGTVTVTVTVGGVSSQPTTFTYLRFL